jgi:hypothetical protein
MVQTNSDSALRDALASFETSVTTPVISGELSDWMEKLRKSWSAASMQMKVHAQALHPGQYEEIAAADAALLRQVELLKAEDEAIEKDRQKFDQTIVRMAEHLPKLEPDEAKAQPHIQSMMDQGIALVTRVRKQEVAVQTWFAEAFNRERGGGD